MSGRQIRLGKVGRRVFYLPLDIATQATALHGVRGKGKTNTVGVMVEGLLKVGVQVVVIDPTDVWGGLKSSADGQGDGFPIVVLGGHHGDLPLLSTSGRVVADFAVNNGASMVLSLRHLRKGEQRKFVLDFAEQLYHRKGEAEHRTPLFLVIDECSTFVPQKVMGDTARLVGAVEDIVRKGRASGLGIALIDQRPASVNKDVLSQAELLVCHAVTGKHDRKALREWIEGKDSKDRLGEFESNLAGLDVGEAWFWHPVADVFQLVSVDLRSTFDSSKTPKLGETAAAPDTVADVDLESLRDALEETIAEADATDPKKLRQRITDLMVTIRNFEARDVGPDPEEVAAMVRDQVDAELVKALRAQRERFARFAQSVALDLSNARITFEKLEQAVEELLEETDDEDGDLEAMDKAERPVVLHIPEMHKPLHRPVAPPAPRTDGVTAPQQRILDALAGLHALGLHEVDRSVAAVFADQSPRSSGKSVV